MLLLALDTATPAVTAAVVLDEQVRSQASVLGAMSHGELLAPMVAAALSEAGVAPADLDCVVAGTGPGPFTGLRVGLVHARVMGLALGIPVHGICTLDVIAAEVAGWPPAGGGRDDLAAGFIVATDARRKEVYWARYDGHGRRLGGPAVGRASEIPGAIGLPAFGAGALAYSGAFAMSSPPEYPDAGLMGLIAAHDLRAGLDLGGTEPLYLRRPDAQPGAAPKKVLR